MADAEGPDGGPGGRVQELRQVAHGWCKQGGGDRVLEIGRHVQGGVGS